MRERDVGDGEVGDSQRREKKLVKNKYKLLQYHLTYKMVLYQYSKKFTISSPDGAWFLCFDGKICQHMAFGYPNANALRVKSKRKNNKNK